MRNSAGHSVGRPFPDAGPDPRQLMIMTLKDRLRRILLWDLRYTVYFSVLWLCLSFLPHPCSDLETFRPEDPHCSVSDRIAALTPMRVLLILLGIPGSVVTISFQIPGLGSLSRPVIACAINLLALNCILGLMSFIRLLKGAPNQR